MSRPTVSSPETEKAPVDLLLWGALGAIILGLLALTAWMRWNAPEQAPPKVPLPVIKDVPEFSLTDRDGSNLTRDDLLGAPWVADFIFTRCAAICPRMTYQMRRVVDGLGDDSPVHFVSFSVDPEHDTPEVLADYARHYEAPPHWHFLTGDREDLHTLSREGFLLLVDDQPAESSSGDPIVHSNRFVLVDAEGRIRSFYDAFDDVELERLLADIDELLSGE